MEIDYKEFKAGVVIKEVLFDLGVSFGVYHNRSVGYVGYWGIIRDNGVYWVYKEVDSHEGFVC